MKTASITVVLLVLVTPALAASMPPKDRAMARQLADAYETCNYTSNPGKSCDRWGELSGKLEARGYCIMARGVVGKPGKLRTQKEWEQIGAAGPVPKDARRCHPVH